MLRVRGDNEKPQCSLAGLGYPKNGIEFLSTTRPCTITPENREVIVQAGFLHKKPFRDLSRKILADLLRSAYYPPAQKYQISASHRIGLCRWKNQLKASKRLLELFPVTSLRHEWPNINGTKEEICFAIAETYGRNDAMKFVSEHISCCKQHVYIYSHGGQLSDLPEIEIPDAELVLDTGVKSQTRRLLYIVNFEYKVVLKNPLEEISLTFLWPLRLDFTASHLIVRFVILEKNISSYVDGRPYYLDRKSTEEETIINQIRKQTNQTLNLDVIDLHKGVKSLWDSGLIDSSRARFKKAFSTAFEAMDEDRMIKEDAPDLYNLLMDSQLFNTLFQVVGKEDCSVSAFSVDPAKGFITFHRYADNIGDSDYVVQQILEHN